MIERYARKDMSRIWQDENRFRLWLDIELAVCEIQEQRGDVPKGCAAYIRKHARIDPKRIDAIEAKTHHDVVAFLDHIAEQTGEKGRFLHYAMTSSDLLDTCLALQLRQSGTLLIKGITRLCTALCELARRHRTTVCIGRTHGIFAEPTTFGLKMAQAFAEFSRQKERLVTAVEGISTAAISGAVGTFAHMPPDIEAAVAKKLGLKVEPISTQVIPRDRHAAFFTTLALCASSLERLATEIRLLQKSETSEVAESFARTQKGSSAMPHKRNPIRSENITGLARLIRSFALPAMENVALWHERDISHSSVERVIGPDATIALDFALDRMTGIIENLDVYPDRMADNLALTCGLYASQSVLLALTRSGLRRDQAYRLVQGHAMRAWKERVPLGTLLDKDKDIVDRLGHDTIRELCGIERHLRHVDTIFDRIFPKP